MGIDFRVIETIADPAEWLGHKSVRRQILMDFSSENHYN